MTSICVCPRCGGEYRSYENGDGSEYGTCYNCGISYTFSRKDADRERELRENHLRGFGKVRP